MRNRKRVALVCSTAALTWLVGCYDEPQLASSQAKVVKCKDATRKETADYRVEAGTFTSPYNCIDNSCHHGANGGVDQGNDGILSCSGTTSGPFGHTVNWDVPEDGTVCLAEPQRPGQGPMKRVKCEALKTNAACTAVAGCGWT